MQWLAHVRIYHGDAITGFDSGWDPGGMGQHSFHGEYRCALDALDMELGGEGKAYDVLGFSLRDVLRQERIKCQKQLSRAVLARKHELWTSTLDADSREYAILCAASGEGRRPLASEWLVAMPVGARTAIPDESYQLAIRKRLDIPVCRRGDACRVPLGVRRRGRPEDPRKPPGRTCGAFLMPHADHAQSCAKHARNLRHDGIADLCAAIYQEAGHTAHRETDVPGVQSTTQKEPIRADVLVRERAPGSWACAEVKVRHCFHGDGDLVLSRASDIDDMLRAEEAGVHAHYRPTRVRPWVLTSLGRPGEAMCADIRRLARRRMQLRDVRDAVSLPSVFQYLLHRWRAELSCSLVLGDADVFFASLRGVPPQGGAPPPVDTHIYDLQSLRASF